MTGGRRAGGEGMRERRAGQRARHRTGPGGGGLCIPLSSSGFAPATSRSRAAPSRSPVGRLARGDLATQGLHRQGRGAGHDDRVAEALALEHLVGGDERHVRQGLTHRRQHPCDITHAGLVGEVPQGHPVRLEHPGDLEHVCRRGQFGWHAPCRVGVGHDHVGGVVAERADPGEPVDRSDPDPVAPGERDLLAHQGRQGLVRLEHDLRRAGSSRLDPPGQGEAGAADVGDAEWPRRQRADGEGEVLDVLEDEQRRVVRLHVRLGRPVHVHGDAAALVPLERHVVVAHAASPHASSGRQVEHEGALLAVAGEADAAQDRRRGVDDAVGQGEGRPGGARRRQPGSRAPRGRRRDRAASRGCCHPRAGTRRRRACSRRCRRDGPRRRRPSDRSSRPRGRARPRPAPTPPARRSGRHPRRRRCR